MTHVEDYLERALPQAINLTGRLVRLEPMQISQHLDGLFVASYQKDTQQRFQYLSENAPQSKTELLRWMEKFESLKDPMFFCVIDQTNNQVDGRQALMRIDHKNGVAEIGHIYWGPDMSKTAKATEAFYLFASYIFDILGYRRLEWKCNNDNQPSKRAAQRFGFSYEGLFRQHMIQKGKNRDTAWFSILDHEWSGLKVAFDQWLDHNNFDTDGRQKQRLTDFIEKIRSSSIE